MEPPERRIVVLGGLEDAGIGGKQAFNGTPWRFLAAASAEAADSLLAIDPGIRVGIWSRNGALAAEDLEKFSVLRSRYRRVKWLALLPPALPIDERLAGLIANDFFDYLTLPVDRERLLGCAGHAYGMSLVSERAQGAPASGEETRRKLGERAREGRDKATDAARQGREFLRNQRDEDKTRDVSRAYNDFWWDSGENVVRTRRTSLSPDGRASGEVQCIRRAQTLDDYFATLDFEALTHFEPCSRA